MTVIALAALIALQGQGQPQQPQQPPPNSPISFEIVMRYFFKAKSEPTGLKVAIEKIKGVSRVTFDTRQKLAMIGYTGKFTDVKKFDEVGGEDAKVISHVPLLFTFKPLEGARIDIIHEELKAIKGTEPSTLKIQGPLVEVLADLRVMNFGTLQAAARNASFEFQLRSPSVVEIALGGKPDMPKILALLEREDGALMVTQDTAAKKFWVWSYPRTIKEDRLKEVIEGAKGELAGITKLDKQ